MLASRGTPVVAGEETLLEANELARAATGIEVDPTGSSGLAGLVALIAEGRVSPDERVAVLFTGAVRTTLISRDERNGDEKLSGQGHPVAQGVRT